MKQERLSAGLCSQRERKEANLNTLEAGIIPLFSELSPKINQVLVSDVLWVATTQFGSF